MPLAPDEPYDDQALADADAALAHALRYGDRRDVTLARAHVGAILRARDEHPA